MRKLIFSTYLLSVLVLGFGCVTDPQTGKSHFDAGEADKAITAIAKSPEAQAVSSTVPYGGVALAGLNTVLLILHEYQARKRAAGVGEGK